MSGALERLQTQLADMASAWIGTALALGGLVALLGLRAIVDEDARRRTRAPAVMLLLALVFHAMAGMARRTGTTDAASVLALMAVLFLAIGLTGLAAVLLFDVALRRRPVPGVVRDLAQVVVLAGIVVATLYEYGFDPVSLAATGGVATAVIGFALQGNIANVFASVSLSLERQVAIGDWITVGGATGRVREIKWRATTLVTKDGDAVFVPNNQLMAAEVVNYSRPTSAHRMWVRVGFHYRHPPNEVRAALLDGVRGVPGVLADPAPDCLVVDFADSAVVYALRFWIDDFLRDAPIEAEVRARIWYAARRAALEIPFPIRTIVPAVTGGEEAVVAERLAALDRVDVFAPVDGTCRTRLATEMREQRFAAGEDVIRQDAPGDSLFVIARGSVDVRVSVGGVERSIAVLGPGQFFGEMSLMTGEPRQATCTALVDTVCYVVDQALFGAVVRSRPEITEHISALLAERQTELEASREGLGAEARRRRASETRSRLLVAIRRALHL
jgi:small-conductance mechanosensitive channel/CRP-like cAMP-binding protein